MSKHISTEKTLYWLRAVSVLCVCAALRCGGELPSEPPVQLALSPSGPQIAQQTAQQFSLRALYKDGSARDLTRVAAWRVSDDSGHDVEMPADGYLQLERAGRYVVRVEYAGRALETPLYVTTASVKSVAISPTSPSVSKGLSLPFTATATFSDGTTQDVTKLATWAVKDVMGTGVATIDTTGVMLAKSVGKATITARYSSHSASTTATVTAATLATLWVSPANPTIAGGTNQQFNAKGTYSDGTTTDLTNLVTWAVTDLTGSGVAAIDGTGLANGKSVGTAQVSADYSGLTAQTTLTVTPAVPVSIVITPASSSIPKGTTQRFICTATLTDGTTQDVTESTAWTATDKTGSGVASINSSGMAIGNNVGTSTIAGAYLGNTATALLTVTPAVLRGLSINPSSASVAQGQFVNLAAIGLYSDGTQQDLSATAAWSTVDVTGMDVATVAAGGQVQGKNVGRAQITATSGLYSATATVDVSPAMYTGLTVSPPLALGSIGGTLQFTAIVTLTDGTTRDVTSSATWSEADALGTGIATVDNKGLASCKVEGVADITAAFGGFTFTSQMLVL